MTDRHESQKVNNRRNPRSMTERGLDSQPADKEFIALGATPKRADLTGLNVLTVVITATGEAAGTPDLEAVAGVVFDSPSPAVSLVWLTPADHLVDDSELVQVKKGESIRKTFIYPLSYVDAVRLVGGETLHVTIEAEDAI